MKGDQQDEKIKKPRRLSVDLDAHSDVRDALDHALNITKRTPTSITIEALKEWFESRHITPKGLDVDAKWESLKQLGIDESALPSALKKVLSKAKNPQSRKGQGK